MVIFQILCISISQNGILKTYYYIRRVLTDLDAPKGAHLMGHNEEGSLNIVTLLLTGRSTPYLHNGVIYVGDEDHYVCILFSFEYIIMKKLSPN